ncbi:hypothetical protein HDU98_005321 [Podochytrium sp. JEL0797]|nr:hypothetical protein HDU98_005321 [Podochytrium sp. JEL0797]
MNEQRISGDKGLGDDTPRTLLPSRCVALVLRHALRQSNESTELLLVCRKWLRLGAAQLYRALHFDAAFGARRLARLTTTLLDKDALLPYALFVRSVAVVSSRDASLVSSIVSPSDASLEVSLESPSSPLQSPSQTLDESILIGDIDTLLQLTPHLASFAWTADPAATSVVLHSLADHAKRLTRLSLRECPLASDALAVALCHSCVRLTHVDLSFTLLSPRAAVSIIALLPHLVTLNMEGLEAHEIDFCNDYLDSSPSSPRPLRLLNLRNCVALSDSHIRSIVQICPLLDAILIDGCSSLSNDAVVAISQACPNLHSLDMSFIPALSDLAMYSIALCLSDSIRYLALSGCAKVGPAGVQMLIDRAYALKRTTGALKQLVLHGCLLILDSYLCAFDDSRTGELECMLEEAEIMKAVGASAATISPPRTVAISPPRPHALFDSEMDAFATPSAVHASSRSFATNPPKSPEDYNLDSTELWMLASYNMRAQINPTSFEPTLFTNTADSVSSGSSTRSSVLSMETIHEPPPPSPSPAAKELKRMSSHSSSSTVTLSNSGTSKGTRLPTPGVSAPTTTSKLPATSKLRESVLAKTHRSTAPNSALAPKSSFLPSPRPSRTSTPTPSTSFKAPSKINFNASTNKPNSIRTPLAKSGSRISAITLSSYSQPPPSKDPASSFSTRSATPTTTTTTASSGYKPRTFKKFNNDTATEYVPSKPPPSRSTVTSTPSRLGTPQPTSTAAPRSTPSASFKPGSSLARLGGGPRKPLSSSTSSPAFTPSRTLPVPSSSSLASTTTTTPAPKPRGLGSALKPPPSSTFTQPQPPTPHSTTSAQLIQGDLDASFLVTSPTSLDSPTTLQEPDTDPDSGFDRWRRRSMSLGNLSTTGLPVSAAASSTPTNKTPGRATPTATTTPSSGLDRWRRTVHTTASPAPPSTGLDKWRKSVSSEDLGVSAASPTGGLDRWRKSVGAGGSGIPGPGASGGSTGVGGGNLGSRLRPTRLR